MTEALAPYSEFDVVERVRSMDERQRQHLSLVIDQDPVLAGAQVDDDRVPLQTIFFKSAGKGSRALDRNTDEHLAADAKCEDPDTASSPVPAARMLLMPDGSGSRPIRRHLSFIGSGSGPPDLGRNIDKYLALDGGYQD